MRKGIMSAVLIAIFVASLAFYSAAWGKEANISYIEMSSPKLSGSNIASMKSIDTGIAETELHAIHVFAQFHYNITSASHSLIRGMANETATEVDATYTFTVCLRPTGSPVVVSGIGNYTFVDSTAYSNREIGIRLSLSGALNLDSTYSAENNSTLTWKHETIQASLVESTLHTYSVEQVTLVNTTGSSIQTTTNAEIYLDSYAAILNITENEEVISTTQSRFSVHVLRSGTFPPGRTRESVIEYTRNISPENETSVVFTRYDVSEGNFSFRLAFGEFRTQMIDAENYAGIYKLVLRGEGKKLNVTYNDIYQLHSNATDWSWKEFGKSVATGAVSGAAGGVATSLLADGPGVLVGGSVGAVAGAATGAVGYCAGYLFDQIFCQPPPQSHNCSCTSCFEGPGFGFQCSGYGTGEDVPIVVGDINLDGLVDIYDAILLSNAFMSTPGKANWNSNADINGDNIVDIYDAIILANHFGQHYP